MKQLLEMIENVDPADTAKLDEIDARVFCYIEGDEFEVEAFDYEQPGVYGYGVCFPQYTRSRDALRAIRPEGWHPCHVRCSPITKGASFALYHWDSNTKTIAPILPTEELAELHAIIQAISHERAQTGERDKTTDK